MAGAEVTDRPASGEWSKTEILGHLTDSAANNHHRFVRAQLMNRQNRGYSENLLE